LCPDPDRLDFAAVAEYFPLRHTVSAMMALVADCLQLRFTPVSAAVLKEAKAIWHPDVEVWSVWEYRPDSEGDFIGYLYADLISRPNKYKGNQSVNLQRVSQT
jgi:metallopeptidase MepB